MDLKKQIEYFQTNYIAISLLCYGIGLFVSYCKYLPYKIPIWFYFTLTDLIFFTIIQITAVAISIVLYSIYLKLIRNLTINKRSDSNKIYMIFKSLNYLPPCILIILNISNIEIFSGSDFTIIFFCMPIAFIILENYNSPFSSPFLTFHVFIIIIYSIILGFFIYKNSTKMLLKHKDTVSFIYNDTIKIITNREKFYIGETSTHLLIYDTIKHNSQVYKKENIDFIKYYSLVKVKKTIYLHYINSI